MNNFSEDYELASSIETELLLVDLPMDVIKESIRYQIQNPLSTRVNYVDAVNDIFRELRTQYAEDPEVLSTVNSYISDFYSFIIHETDQKFDLGIDTETFETADYLQVGTAVYNFIILRYQKNITKFIQRYIAKNKKALVEHFDRETKKKDVTTIATKKKVKNKDDALIISNLPSVINYIINIEVEPAIFISYASNDELYEASILQDLIRTGRMLGNFTEKYLDHIREGYDVLDDIQTDVKMKLMKKF